VDVALLRWPAEADRRDDLSVRRVPRLLLVDADVDPPAPLDCLEDWARAGTPERDVRTRVDALGLRAAVHADHAPHLDGDGVLRYNENWVALPPVEARLASLLVQRFGAVVSRDALSRAGWPSTPTGRNALDVHILRLRRRLVPTELVIRTVRSRGYLLERAGMEAAPTPRPDSALVPTG
jgi:DNA-binding winged helix-turn-helix (wHTH) protein